MGNIFDEIGSKFDEVSVGFVPDGKHLAIIQGVTENRDDKNQFYFEFDLYYPELQLQRTKRLYVLPDKDFSIKNLKIAMSNLGLQGNNSQEKMDQIKSTVGWTVYITHSTNEGKGEHAGKTFKNDNFTGVVDRSGSVVSGAGAFG